MNVDMTKWVDMAMAYAPSILLALLTLIIGFWIIGKIVKMLRSRKMTLMVF